MHFNLALIQFLANHRNPVLTNFFLFWTFIGDTNGYILIVTLIYTTWDKRLALRLAALVLVTSVSNHLLKLAIKDPRPFVKQGTYLKEWAVPKSQAIGLAADYSTPSGHAMDAGAFYPYLIKFTNNRILTAVCVTAAILIGLSRPYLGVHYVEDILLGWAIGGLLSILAVRYTDFIAKVWSRVSYSDQILGAVAISFSACIISLGINHWKLDDQPKTLSEFTGFLTGIVVAQALEETFVKFDPRSASWLSKTARYLLTVAAVMLTTYALGRAFQGLTTHFRLLGYFLDYVRYITAGLVVIFFMPLLFTKVGLCSRILENQNQQTLEITK